MLKKLNDDFKEIVKNNPPTFALRARFDSLNGAFNEKNIISEFGECRLKVLLIVTELLELNYSKNDIVNFLHSNYGSSSYNRKWVNQLHDNIDRYAGEADALIDGGYRWLIHSQRPNILDLKSSVLKEKMSMSSHTT